MTKITRYHDKKLHITMTKIYTIKYNGNYI
jgi:hypothetical protein